MQQVAAAFHAVCVRVCVCVGVCNVWMFCVIKVKDTATISWPVRGSIVHLGLREGLPLLRPHAALQRLLPLKLTLYVTTCSAGGNVGGGEGHRSRSEYESVSESETDSDCH